MLIRTEAPADILPVDQLLKGAFETPAEASLVMSLRENGKRSLSLVACSDEGEVIGYVLFSQVLLKGEDRNWQGLAPLAVKEEFRNQGIGELLVKEGLASLAELGYPVCVVLGNPAYYQRFGFVPAHQHQLSCEWDVPEDAFQVTGFEPEHLDGVSGQVQYSEEFAAV